jgi:polyketide cyclase/dehydrase/lipid transport protein
MPTFDDVTTSAAPVEEVWKLLYDPSRFPEWWEGVETVEEPKADGFTLYPRGYPDFPMPHAMRSDGHRLTISCLISHLVFEWRLEPTRADGTRIGVHVEIPDEEAHRLDAQRGSVSASLRSLAALAAATDAPPAPG